ncbi:RNA polymerase II CTD heptapeptide repeat phosphatase [Emydomyces testavorans]|uniref:RNA polymerase II subunit B1 CTD phosphatase RPAP2 homolog n=1 Tax=Emydomyces testavorans TaxID=2070801 RepID=A0AAF0IJV7_9EURO|nr:RNA polymerase II CTD heptapeptide repeat phosphatase [Emydomyces testavorans]
MDPSTDAPSRKSILKTSIPAVHACSTTAGSYMNYSPQGKSANPRHLAIALHHARHIQAQKDAEAIILSHIEHLMTLPSAPDADPTSPSEEDVSALKSALVPFQPSDYDNLILERNIDGRCGYALCPMPHRREDPKAKFRIIWGPKGSGPGGRGKEMKVVPKEQLEKWCSDECGERALYIRVQLNEEPAWERVDRQNLNILLLEEGRQRGETDKKGKQAVSSMPIVEDKFRNLSLGPSVEQEPEPLDPRQRQAAASRAVHSELLAMEKGDSPITALDEEKMSARIIEKDAMAAPAPTLQPDSMQGGSIEGFHPQSLSYSMQGTPPTVHDPTDDDILL